jgi:hypothetical protein
VGAESFHAGIQTVDMTEVIVAFRNFANAPLKNSIRKELFHCSACFISSVAALLCHGVMDVVSFMEVFYIVYQ